MSDTIDRAIAICGVGAILPDAPDAGSFWANLQAGRYSISEVSADRWDPARYFDPDPHAPEKTYSKIGGWVRAYAWEPARWKLPVPPKVGDAMDIGQKWAVACTREALLDYGYPDRPLDRARTAVILGNAMAGELHYLTALRVFFPEFAAALAGASSVAALEPRVREAILAETRALLGNALPAITEDTMPGELSNCIAGRIASLFDFHGPNYVVDAACASAVAAMSSAIEGLVEHDYDAVITGGVDRNMGPSAFVKFCKIGALSATGTRPYADGADGFVMGEGAVVFVLKRLADAERAGDRIYAVVRGVGGSSDGRGKGITAPNPVGQRLAVERAWRAADLSPATVSLVEGHGTSTRVGDVVEFEALGEVLRAAGAAPRTIPLGSVKSNIGHLKAAAGAAGLLKVALALHHKMLPPSLGFARPNPNIDFERSPLAVNTALVPWREPACGVRRAGLSAFGFGGTNFHAVLEEHVPGALTRGRVSVAGAAAGGRDAGGATVASAGGSRDGSGRVALAAAASPLRGALVLGADSPAALIDRLASAQAAALAGKAPPPAPPARAELAAPVRLAIDFGDAAELADKAGKAGKVLRSAGGGEAAAAAWKMLRQQGVFFSQTARAERGKLAFLYTGQGSQYVGMLGDLRASQPVVAETFAEADRLMAPLLGGRTLSSYIFIDTSDPAARARAEEDLKQTAITQPALLATDLALTRLLATYGIQPDLVMGHSLGEYGALVAAGVLPFAHALEAVSARGREMTNVAVADAGWMVAVTAPLPEIEAVVAATDGYVVVANINSPKQAVIGGASAAVERAMQALVARGFSCVRLPVSHAFHTQIVAPASGPLRQVLERLDVRPPRLPVVANVTGALYPAGDAARPEIVDLLARQVASPVQFVKGLETLYGEGVRTFVEVGPKRALAGLADDTLGHLPGVLALSTNHPKLGDFVAFNQALCGLYAAGFGAFAAEAAPASVAATAGERTSAGASVLGRAGVPEARPASSAASPSASIVVTGAALGLPGTPRVFDDGNVARMLRGDSLIDVVPSRHRRAMLDRHIVRVVKSEDGSGRFQRIEDPDEVIRLAGRGGALDLEAEFGVDAERVAALDATTRLAIAAGLDALRDAGIPLVHRYKTTTTGSRLPDRWGLPDALRDETGVIFASAFPGLDAFSAEAERYHRDVARREQIALIDHVLAELPGGDSPLAIELTYRRAELVGEQDQHGYAFDRRFLFRILPMGHSQFAELIGARGPNTAINSACASTTQAIAVAEDWIRAGRCRRVIVVAGDDVTSEHLFGWIGSGFLSTGAAATDDVVERAALPFDRRRHGMIMGMGGAAIVLEHPDAARERGLDPIAEVLGTVTANSAFHGTRLDVAHIAQVMERVVRAAEASSGVPRQAMAGELMFVSHETYTPARGGSASAEIHALRTVFGDAADRIVITNTKGLTGHAMAVGIEDVVAIKALETGVVPPVPNHREVDPELGALRLSRGGPYPVRYALRLGAGFGSQISMSLLRWTATPDGVRRPVTSLGYDYRLRDRAAWQAWLAQVAGSAQPELEIVQRTLRVKDPSASGERTVRATRGAVASAAPIAPAKPAAAPPSGADRPVAAIAATAGAGGAPPGVAATASAARPAGSSAAVAPPIAPAREISPASATASQDDPVRARVLAIIAEKTGYPIDMLDDGLDLEADLGVDTVKQAETFAAVRGAYEIPRKDDLKLRDFPTIAHVVRFVYTHRPDLAPAAAVITAPAPAGGPATGSAPSASPAVAVPASAAADAAAFPRRIPAPVLRPALALCKPTGVTLSRGTRVVVCGDHGGAVDALIERLAGCGVEVVVLGGDEPLDEVAARAGEAGQVAGVYWLAALDDEGDPARLSPAAFHDALTLRVKRLAAVTRALYGALAAPGSFVVAATRMGGAHGYDAEGASAPLGGAVTGFLKTLARERPAALCKAIDFASAATPAEIADALIAETLADPGAVEIGTWNGHRIAIGLVEAPLTGELAPRGLAPPGAQVVVTGAAGSIVAAITADLAARAPGATFHLLDLAPPPDRDDPDLQQFARDREGLRRVLFERHKARGERVTPAAIERTLAGLERQYAALTAIEAVAAAGGTARYHQVDLCDAGAVDAALAEVRAAGKLDLLIHAAGLEISRALPDKTDAEFARVFDVKAGGWCHLIAGLGTAPLGAAVVFGSIAGRFGNPGQTDYSAANDLLCKLISNLRRTRPETRGVAIDWTAWAGIGMASRGSIPKVMELAQITMLPADVGVPVVARELVSGGGEVVVAGGLGELVRERDAEGGLDTARAAALPHGPMIDRVLGMGVYAPLVAEATLDPVRARFLDDHRIEGTAVLPGVMGIEGFAELASLVVPGARVAAAEHVRFEAPFKFYRDEPRTLRLEARLSPDGSDVIADCRLIGERKLPGKGEPQRTVHFTGRLRLCAASEHPPLAMGEQPPRLDGPPSASAADIYRTYFHGPAYQVLDGVWATERAALGSMAEHLPPDVDGAALVIDPRRIELCFQTAGIWDIRAHGGHLALPREIDELTWNGGSAAGPVVARVHARDDGRFDAEVLDGSGAPYLVMRGYRTISVDPGAVGP